YGQRLYSLGDYAGALDVWLELAQQGDARAQYSLAVMFHKGRGVEADKEKALEWAGRAAEQGYKPGQDLLRQLKAKDKVAKDKAANDKAANDKAAKPKKKKVAVKRKPRKPPKPIAQMTEMERVEWSVEEMLLAISEAIAEDGALHYGVLRAREQDGAVQILVPDIVYQSNTGNTLDLGDITARFERLDDRYDLVTFELPNEVRYKNDDGSSGRITMAERLGRLRWDRRLETTTEFEFRLGQLALLFDGSGEMGRIGEVLVKSDVVEKQGLWTGPMRLSLSDLDITNEEQGNVRLDSVALVLDMRGLNLSSRAAKVAAKENGEKAKAGGMPALDKILTMASGVGLRVRIAGLSVQSPDQGDFQLAEADYGFQLSSPDQKLLNFELTVRHNGLRGTDSAAPEDMVPQDMEIILSLENMPIDTIVNEGVTTSVEVALAGKVSSGPEVFKRLQRDLSAAATVLRLKQAKVTARDYDITLGLTLLADAVAKAGFVGGGDLRLRGLGKVLTTLGLQDVGPIADLVKKGRPIDGGKGLLFALAVRPDGQLTVNGDAVFSLTPFPEKAK
ncbi:MAG: sel1 repeat family protein, partial [Rhodospirillaceae bacterium]|nr:sel1 repeat family protein [Rhodospirillaceae bacterium]